MYRGTGLSGVYTRIGTTSSTSYTDINRSLSTAYYYRVTAYNNAGVSDPSNTVSVSTLRDNTKLAIAASSDTIVVEWPRDESLGKATRVTNLLLDLFIPSLPGLPSLLSVSPSCRTSYVIYRDDILVREIDIPTSLTWTVAPPFFTTKQDSSKLNHFFVDTGRNPNTTYKYRVAVNSHVEYGPLELSRNETDTVMTDYSATTWPR